RWSASTWPKSGLMVPTSARSELRPILKSAPAQARTTVESPTPSDEAGAKQAGRGAGGQAVARHDAGDVRPELDRAHRPDAADALEPAELADQPGRAARREAPGRLLVERGARAQEFSPNSVAPSGMRSTRSSADQPPGVRATAESQVASQSVV